MKKLVLSLDIIRKIDFSVFTNKKTKNTEVCLPIKTKDCKVSYRIGGIG